MSVREYALSLVADERDWQESALTLTAAHQDCPDVLRLSALMEEVGEVARCVHDGDPLGRLREELTHTAAVAVAWIEALA